LFVIQSFSVLKNDYFADEMTDIEILEKIENLCPKIALRLA